MCYASCRVGPAQRRPTFELSESLQWWAGAALVPPYELRVMSRAVKRTDIFWVPNDRLQVAPPRGSLMATLRGAVAAIADPGFIL